MRKLWLVYLLLVILAASFAIGEGTNAHRDNRLLPKGCASCHANHGAATVLLNEAGPAFCLQCHGSETKQKEARKHKRLGGDPGPLPDIGAEFQKLYAHTMVDDGLAVGCLTCHIVHPKNGDLRYDTAVSNYSKSPSANDLCFACHETLSDETTSAVSGHVDPDTGGELLCMDCHGSDERAKGYSGIHGSNHEGLLKRAYALQDGTPESAQTYALCYGCHDRDEILNPMKNTPHALHVGKNDVSCSVCHDPHYSARTGMIRFDLSKVFALDGKLDYSRGSGCTLVCHGVPHDMSPNSGSIPLPSPGRRTIDPSMRRKALRRP